MNKYKKILVVCPSGAVTGGPEALHQLVGIMNELGLPAFIVYLPFDTVSVTPVEYLSYAAPISEYDDSDGNLIIFPEVYPMLALKVKFAKAAIWWLSLDNFLERRHNSFYYDKFRYFKKTIKRDRPLCGVRSLQGLIHFSQSSYASQYLASKNIVSYDLKESINQDFLTNQYLDKIDHKKNVILYNPTKGFKITEKLIKAYPELEFIALKGLNRQQLSEVLFNSKLYIDFGHHPGRDRMPREAVMHGCCIITGLLGSAGNEFDIPIPCEYKIDTYSSSFVNKFGKVASDIMINFDAHYLSFNDYRLHIKKEPELYKQQIVDIFSMQ